MSNLARARSHLIFIVALLSAAAYILWVERGRGLPLTAPAESRAWTAEVGPFPTATEAGRVLDGSGITAEKVLLVRTSAGTSLRVHGLAREDDARRLCGAVGRTGSSCEVRPPAA